MEIEILYLKNDYKNYYGTIDFLNLLKLNSMNDFFFLDKVFSV